MTIDLELWATEIQKGHTGYLSRTITLLESTQKSKQEQGQAILKRILKEDAKSWRIAISGVPGVGKSTFVNAFGKSLIERGKRVAVLAIDPSSKSSRGSILGDKTRMANLAQNPKAYIRPTPTSGSLGGVAHRTHEAILCCEAAGFDVILIETVGVGQSETTASEITDLFLYLKIPQTGDDLQGMKRGIMELADLIFVNKSDVFPTAQRNEALSFLKKSMPFLRQKNTAFKRRILNGSALSGDGIQAVIELCEAYYEKHWVHVQTKRKEQEGFICEKYATQILIDTFRQFLHETRHSFVGSQYEKAAELVRSFLETQKLR